MLVVPLKLGSLIAGMALVAFAAIATTRRQAYGKTSLLMAVIGLVAYFTFGFPVGERIRFAWLRPKYEARLKEILATLETDAGASARGFPDCVLDEGPPIRVAFFWHRGVVDNWVGLVHDPTGGVLKANEFKRDWSNWSDPKLRPVKQMFGGDMYRARNVGKNWYLCWFT